MYCKYCNVNVKSDNNICPLCHNVLTGETEDVNIFPKRKIRKFKKPITFSSVYWFIAVSVMLICGTINILKPTNIIWSLIVFLSLIYIFFLVKNTIMYKGSGGSKIYTQTVSLSILLILFQYIIHTKQWAYSYALPIIVILSLLAHILFVSIYNKKSHHYVRYMAITSIIGMIPTLLYTFHVIDFYYLAYISFVISAITLIGVILFAGKILSTEFQKKGHI